MREAGVVITNPMDDRELTVFEQAFESCHTGLNSELVVELAKLVRPQPELGPRTVVGIVCVRYDGIQAVIGAGEFDHDEDARSSAHRRRGGGFVNRACAKASDAATKADQ